MTVSIMNELLDQVSFIEPKGFLSFFGGSEKLTNEWIQLFYIGRTIFSQKSEFPIKGQLAPILERKKNFSKDRIQERMDQSYAYESLVKSNMVGSLDIGKITSLDQIAHILPREFVIYPEDFFYAKLLKRELYKKEFNDEEGFSVDDLVYGKDQPLNRKQKVYILFDNSFSMNGDKFNKLFAAKAICLEYLRRAQKESPQIYFRYFNQDMGPLIKVNNRGQIKDLIEYIVHLTTYDCYETKVGDAILRAIEDIKMDTELRQAEILMITDGLGDIPPNMEKQLGKIKFHMILIPGVNIDQFLKKYPDKEAWGKVNIPMESVVEISRHVKDYSNREAWAKAYIPNELRGSLKKILALYPNKDGWGKADNKDLDIPPYWETFAQLIQLYRLQEVAEIFIKIPSLFSEKFTFSNMYELEQIKEVRKHLTLKLESPLSNSERYEVYQKIKFFMKYLRMLMAKEPATKELQKSIKKELNDFQILLKRIMEDEWFVSTLDTSSDNSMETNFKKAGKGLAFKMKVSHRPVVGGIFLGLIRFLLASPRQVVDRVCFIYNSTWKCVKNIYRRQILKKKFSYIKSQASFNFPSSRI